MPNMMAALPNTGGALCSTPQSLPDANTRVPCSNAAKTLNWLKLEMWANAQRDGGPAGHRWRPLFNAAKFGWRSLLYCCAVTLPRCEGRWNLEGYPKLVNRSQPLVSRSSPYCRDMWRTYCCSSSFFFLTVDTCLRCKDIARQICAMVTFLCPVFAASSVQQVSDLHLKFALRPHHVRKYGRHPICGWWD